MVPMFGVLVNYELQKLATDEAVSPKEYKVPQDMQEGQQVWTKGQSHIRRLNTRYGPGEKAVSRGTVSNYINHDNPSNIIVTAKPSVKNNGPLYRDTFPDGHVFPEDHLDPYTFADRMRTVAQDYKDRGGTVPAQKNTSPFASIRNTGRSILNKLYKKPPPPLKDVFNRYRDAQR